ncbi:hypothetical protein [Sphingobium sp. EM0848]|uniref:hypothetical protein n=1 Tax=Sphingobium sp. EM0848 TaxID=2743473 RepID=UPI00159BF490|nr:hypothetical protein [Sphingobium sp. EM0848]
MKKLTSALLALTLLAGSAAPALAAAPCKDAKGKFIKCPPQPAAKPAMKSAAMPAMKPAAKPMAKPTAMAVAKPAAKKAPCRDAKGRFTKCK